MAPSTDQLVVRVCRDDHYGRNGRLPYIFKERIENCGLDNARNNRHWIVGIICLIVEVGNVLQRKPLQKGNGSEDISATFDVHGRGGKAFGQQPRDARHRHRQMPSIPPFSVANLAYSWNRQKQNTTRFQDALKGSYGSVQIKNEVQCLRQNNAIEQIRLDVLCCGEIDNAHGARRVRIDVKHIAPRHALAAKTDRIVVVRNFQDSPAYVVRMLLQKRFDEQTIDRSSEVKSPLAADGLKAEKIAKFHLANFGHT